MGEQTGQKAQEGHDQQAWWECQALRPAGCSHSTAPPWRRAGLEVFDVAPSAHALLQHLLHKLCRARSMIISPGSPSTLVTGVCKPCDGCHGCFVQPSGMGMLIRADSSRTRTNTTSWAPDPAHRFVCTVELFWGDRTLNPEVW